MPMLGDILAAARRSSAGFMRWLDSDPPLAAQVTDAAAAAGESPAVFIRTAPADFATYATEEDWATLLSRLKDSADPGTDCLLVMVRWRVRLSACASSEKEPVNERKA
ncbi:MAG: hypothetical protein ACLFWF_05860 [Alphaproteobacteria bacterium]